MASLEDLKELAATEQGLCVVSSTRPDGSVHSSVVNAGIMSHPRTGEEVVALVAVGGARKVALMTSSGRGCVTFRRGWQWASAEGNAEVTQVNKPVGDVEYPQLLRDVFVAAGGTHDDWETYDQVMADDGRIVVFITIDRILSNR